MATINVRYIVNDVEAAIRFYTEYLGFKVETHPAPGFAQLARDGLTLMLNAPGAGGAGQAMPDGQLPRAGGWNRIQIRVPDLAALHATLQSRGAKFRNDIVEGQGGKQVLLLDPSGNLIELLEPKPSAAAIKPAFRGIFLTSEHPAATAKFYRDVTMVELEQVGTPGEYVYWKSDRDGMQLAIHDVGKFAAPAVPAHAAANDTHLYFRIAGLEQFRAHLQKLHIEPSASDDGMITVTDPDGRRVMFGTA